MHWLLRLVAACAVLALSLAILTTTRTIAWDVVFFESVRQLVNWALTLVVWVTLIYVVISWVNPLAPVAPALSTLLRPLLEPLQRIVPAVRGIDLSPMALLILVYVLQIVIGRLTF